MKILKIVYNSLIAIIVIATLLVIISLFPITGNYKIMVVQSGSMEPTIKTGAVIVVKPADNYQIDDVITFAGKDEKKTTTHRIIGTEDIDEKKNFVTKGDANNAEDSSRVVQENIIGKVLFSIPYIGYAVVEAKKPMGFALLILIPTGIIITEEIRNIYKELKKRKRGKKEDNLDIDVKEKN